MSTPSFRWGVPGVSIPRPPTRGPIPTRPTAWDELTFTPLGAYDVRRHLGVTMDETGRFNLSRDKFLASDVAFLAAGASEDGHHAISADKFSKEFHDLYDSLPQGPAGSAARKDFRERVRKLIFDLDRATGGTTIIIHSSGTTVPDAPLVPERLEAQVYLPPRFLAEHPETHATIAFLVQTYIEHVGIPTARDWRNRAEKIWSMTQQGRLTTPVLPTTLIPVAPANSALYIFKGRPWGALKLDVPPPSPLQTAAPVPAQADDTPVYDLDDISFGDDTLALLDAMERAEQLEAENRTLRETIEALKEREHEYHTELDIFSASVSRLEFFQDEWTERENGYRAERDMLTSTVRCLEEELRARGPFSRSPARTQRTIATPTRPPAYSRLAMPSIPHISRLGSPTPHVASPRRDPSSPRVVPTDGDSIMPRTDRFLADHALTHLGPMVELILRSVPAMKWSDELRRLTALMPEHIDTLMVEMDKDKSKSEAP
ncbi:hypothetical protein B0H14DRAFT_3127003 [Mycena olivaceomarginata]|nr:hypothetical protein B0H14DRAFT_3127003 [Mycena olivaceomarginata]